jgi:hypothetical protein
MNSIIQRVLLGTAVCIGVAAPIALASTAADAAPASRNITAITHVAGVPDTTVGSTATGSYEDINGLRARTSAATNTCSINNFSPRSVVVGASPVTVTFGISVSGCTLSSWELDDSATPGFYASNSGRQDTFDPSYYYNSYAGTSSVVATVYSSSFNRTERTFAYGFDLKRRVAVQGGTLNASPEPVRKGGTVTISARLVVVDWDAIPPAYVAFGGHYVAIQFRTTSGAYQTVKNVKTDSAGWVHATATQSTSGLWRIAYGGTTVFSPATLSGDYVAVSG